MPNMNEDQRKHLELIQSIISRLSSNSFTIKGWCITLVTALLALLIKQPIWVSSITALPIILFWWQDAYFLRQERLFRYHYEQVRIRSRAESREDPLSFSMDVEADTGNVAPLAKVAFSHPVWIFYGALLGFVATFVVFGVIHSKIRHKIPVHRHRPIVLAYTKA